MRSPFLLQFCVLLVVFGECFGSFESDMQALEADLRDEEMKKSKSREDFHHHDLRSITQLSTEELLKELKKEEEEAMKAVSVKQRFHQLTAGSTSDQDFKQLLNAADEKLKKSQNLKRNEKHEAKKSKDERKKTPSNGSKSKKSTSSKQANLDDAKTMKNNVNEAELLKRALQTIQELTDAEQKDTDIQRRGMKMLKELMLADKQAIETKTSAKRNEEKKQAETFLTALNADSAKMKKLFDENEAQEKTTKKDAGKIAEIPGRFGKDTKDTPRRLGEDKQTKNEKTSNVLRELEEINSHDIATSGITHSNETYNDGLSSNLVQLMADDLVKKIADEMEEDAITKKEVGADETCRDTRTDCYRLTDYCQTRRSKLEKICPRTCQYCKYLRPCEDKWKGKMAHRCQIIRRANRCEEKGVDQYCAQTCGYCSLPSPPKCSKTKFGCCWDKETVKLNSKGTNCKLCKNDYIWVCKRFKVECGSANKAGTFMRRHCPETCQVCTGQCRDDPAKAFYCSFWKKDLDWCNKRPEQMRQFCPVTCGIC